ncbi:glycosyltransferase [Desulfomicrobium escambiense]|uniref:glycosyltransferase n=1 Tax=Desulfomicrobium escambiense TaxID=29503 RepID=UPI000411E399|nr:glycosyltransferase [Desulfomicrobium escambiense]
MKRERVLVLFGADSRLEWGRSFQLAKAFAQNGHDVAYVNLPDPIFTFGRMSASMHVGKLDAHFDVFTPKLGLPYGRLRFLRGVNSEIIFHQIKTYLNDNSYMPSVLWIYSPYDPKIAKNIAEKFDVRKIIYDLADDRVALATASRGMQSGFFVDALEREVSDICSCLASINENLLRIKRKLHDSIHIVPNGVDLDTFDPDREYVRPPFYANLRGRIFLYAGAVESWIDQGVVRAAAARYPNDTFVFLGPVRTNVSGLRSMGNVVFPGRVGYREVPSYIRFANLCMIPFLDNDVTRSCDPLKALQYIAMRKPVLSTRYGGARDYDGLVCVANTGGEFVDAIETVIARHANVDERIRNKILEDWSWKTVAAKALEHV